MSYYVFCEYQEVLDEDLKNHIKNTALLHKYFREDWGKLKAQQYIFIHMLMYTYDIKIHNEQISNSKNEKSNNLLNQFTLYAVKILLIKKIKKFYFFV